jgi:hypothetical protein
MGFANNLANQGSIVPYTQEAADYYLGTQAPDPYAQWGGQANYNKLRGQFTQGRDALFNSANLAGDTAASQYQTKLENWLYGDKQQQNSINNKAVNNEMAKLQGSRGVLGMVGRGIKSSGVMLANKNAGDSSAAGALANAYGEIGQREQSGINNQYEVAQNQVGLEQSNLDEARALQMGQFGREKNDTVNSIIADAESKMVSLNAMAADASLPDRIAIEQEKNRIRSEAMAKLQQYDSLLSTQAKETSADTRRGEANRLSSLGTASTNPFQFTSEVPAQFQGQQSPAGSSLPIYTYGRNKRTA